MELHEVAALGWCDLYLEGVAWTEDGRDLVFRLLLHAHGMGSRRRRVLVCRWSESVAIRLAMRSGHGGYPLTWNAEFDRLPDGRCAISFDFAGDGEVRLVCVDVEVTEAAGPATSPVEGTSD